MRLPSRHFSLLARTLLLQLESLASAGKIPLLAEELIVVGQVQSHRDQIVLRDEGSPTTHVFLTVRVESIEKGDNLVELEESIVRLFRDTPPARHPNVK